MTKQEFDLKYCGEKVAVHCDTEEKAKAFLKLAKSFGYGWGSGKDQTHWEVYKNETCYSIENGIMYYGSFGFYEEENSKIEPFELEKENNMKFKVGQKVRVRSDLVVGRKYASIYFAKGMQKYMGKILQITYLDKDNMPFGYRLQEATGFWWTDEMLEPVETFKVGDVVYDLYGDKAKIVDIKPCYLLEGYGYYVTEEQIKKVKPLKKITKEQLKEMGYELE